jgi:hypothetical protein
MLWVQAQIMHVAKAVQTHGKLPQTDAKTATNATDLVAKTAKTGGKPVGLSGKTFEITFGELLNAYESGGKGANSTPVPATGRVAGGSRSGISDTVIGILRRAKRGGWVWYEGDRLVLGQNVGTRIRLLKTLP